MIPLVLLPMGHPWALYAISAALLGLAAWSFLSER